MNEAEPSLRVLGLVTARGGSKGIPRKNIVEVAGKPLVAWTLEAALASSLDRVVVSTDDGEIADVARRWGGEVPFRRPAELARDDSPHLPVVRHAVEWLEEHEGYRPDVVALLQPTSPLREPRDIDGAIRLMEEKGADSVVAVAESPVHPYQMYGLTEEGRLEGIGPRPEGYVRRQEVPPVYVVNGAIYLMRRALLETADTFVTESAHGYLMPRSRSLDVDDPWELRLADLLLRERERV